MMTWASWPLSGRVERRAIASPLRAPSPTGRKSISYICVDSALRAARVMAGRVGPVALANPAVAVVDLMLDAALPCHITATPLGLGLGRRRVGDALTALDAVSPTAIVRNRVDVALGHFFLASRFPVQIEVELICSR